MLMLSRRWATFGRLPEGLAMVEEVVAGLRAAQPPRPADLINALDALGSAYNKAGRQAEHVATYREALALAQRTLGEDHFTVAVLHHNLAGALDAAGEADEALAHSELALSLAARSVAPTHAFPLSAVLLNARLRCAAGDRGDRHARDSIRCWPSTRAFRNSPSGWRPRRRRARWVEGYCATRAPCPPRGSAVAGEAGRAQSALLQGRCHARSREARALSCSITRSAGVVMLDHAKRGHCHARSREPRALSCSITRTAGIVMLDHVQGGRCRSALCARPRTRRCRRAIRSRWRTRRSATAPTTTSPRSRRPPAGTTACRCDGRVSRHLDLQQVGAGHQAVEPDHAVDAAGRGRLDLRVDHAQQRAAQRKPRCHGSHHAQPHAAQRVRRVAHDVVDVVLRFVSFAIAQAHRNRGQRRLGHGRQGQRGRRREGLPRTGGQVTDLDPEVRS